MGITKASSHIGAILGELYDSLDEEDKELMVGVFNGDEE